MLYTALILGLAGSLHCMVMCGPLAMLLQVKARTGITSNLLYHAGRISTYALLGCVFGVLGRVLNIVTTQSVIFIVIGALFLAYQLLPKRTKNAIFMLGFLNRQINSVKTTITKVLDSKSPFVSYAFGLLNGLIPCGLVYFALLAALAMPSWQQSVAYMVFFGLGTIPLLFFAVPVGTFLKMRFGQLLPIKQSHVIALLGVLFVLRGLNLGIPYISPKVVLNTPHTIESNCGK